MQDEQRKNIEAVHADLKALIIKHQAKITQVEMLATLAQALGGVSAIMSLIMEVKEVDKIVNKNMQSGAVATLEALAAARGIKV
jgi:hypothetical protein